MSKAIKVNKNKKQIHKVSNINHTLIALKDIKIYCKHNQTFNIFPWNTFSRKIEILISFMNSFNIASQQRYIKQITKCAFMKNKYYKKEFINTLNSFWAEGKNLTIIVEDTINKIRRFRGVLRRFLHRWRVSRLRIINTEDIVTMEKPKDPITIVDWSSRSMCVFEASTIMRDITIRLLHHDGFFESSQAPRNIFTNIPLTQAQNISVWIQLAKSRVTASSAFTSFRQIRWNISRFMNEYSIPLQLHALRKTMAILHHQEYKERMIDFIEYCYEQNNELCDIYTFQNALIHSPNHKLLKSWASLCTFYYEAPIVYCKSVFHCDYIQEKILIKSINLLHRDNELL